MNLRDELSNWFEFYRELGIEEFYRREPGAAVELPALALAARPQDDQAPDKSVEPVLSSPDLPISPSPVHPISRSPDLPISGSPDHPILRSPDHPIIGPPIASLSLFESPPPKPSGPETLEQIRADLGDCRRCKLAGGRHSIVFGDGNPHAELVFVGEGPGADEDAQGLPFVGRAGQLLNRMIQAIGMKREEVYICNIVKCRPPGNRTPEKDEIETCSPFLFRQLATIKPRLTCCLGAPAAKTILGIKEGITRIHGQFYDFAGGRALATVHPAYVLRSPSEEKILREDFEKIRDFLKDK